MPREVSADFRGPQGSLEAGMVGPAVAWEMPWPDAATLLAPLAPWFEGARRELPWRAQDLDHPHPDPYAVLVSELMLQQTQVATVLPYFRRWMERFPTPGSLAGQPEDAVHKEWEGLGYYRRARHLQAAATVVAEEGWPLDLDALAELPGLGPYTAAAVGAIAFQWPTPALDGNAFRVLARLLEVEGDPRTRAGDLRAWLAPALTVHGPSRLTQALMELGATICQPLPRCTACPLADRCRALQAGRTAELPPVLRRPPPGRAALWLLALEAEGCFLLQPPARRGLLAGLWQWPTLPQEAAPGGRPAPGPGLRSWPGWTQVYTHRREAVTPLHLVLETAPSAPGGLRWVPVGDLSALPLGRRDQRLRDLLGSPGQPPLGGPEPTALLQALGIL